MYQVDFNSSSITASKACKCSYPWHVLHVTANHEKKVAQHLTVRTLEHYLPLYVERSRWTDRFVTLERPLFLGYIFVRYSPQIRRSIVTIPGVIRFLGDSPSAIVSSDEIDRIRAGLASGCLLRPHFDLAIGARVRVRRGIFEGAEGLVREIRHQCKVILSLPGVTQYFSLEIDREDIDILCKTGAGYGFGGTAKLSDTTA
jgi:transcription antitermination factor NusG